MFGYVKPYSSLLRVKDYEFYKAVYCGLCGCTAKCNGCSSTLTLSYDVAFLALVRMALSGERFTVEKKRCPVHPLKKRPHVARCKELEFCSDIGVLLTYYKIIDNVNDEKGKKRFAARLMLPPFAKARRKVIKHGGAEADAIINEGLSELHRLENEHSPSADETSDTFARMLSRLASLGLEGSSRVIAENAAFAVGKWIYIADAVDDVESDRITGSYNPIIELYSGEKLSKTDKEDIFLALANTRERLKASLDLIDYNMTCDPTPDENTSFFSDELSAVIENIVTVGMTRTEQIITESKKD